MIEFVDTERGRFAVQSHGPAEAPPVVLIAGLGDDHASWEPVLPYLSPARRCVTFDNRGIGLSPITPGPYRIADLAEDAHALHQALGLAPCVAIGSSMGGAICQEWALNYPADVSNPPLGPVPPRSRWRPLTQWHQSLAHLGFLRFPLPR